MIKNLSVGRLLGGAPTLSSFNHSRPGPPAPARLPPLFAVQPFKVSVRPLKGIEGPLLSVGFPMSSLEKA